MQHDEQPAARMSQAQFPKALRSSASRIEAFRNHFAVRHRFDIREAIEAHHAKFARIDFDEPNARAVVRQMAGVFDRRVLDDSSSRQPGEESPSHHSPARRRARGSSSTGSSSPAGGHYANSSGRQIKACILRWRRTHQAAPPRRWHCRAPAQEEMTDLAERTIFR